MWTRSREQVAAISLGLVSAGLAILWLTRSRKPVTSSSKTDQADDKRRTVSENSGMVNYGILRDALNLSNPQVDVVLQYMVEKSPFKEHQIEMDRSGCLERVGELLFNTTCTDTIILCCKVFMNISTNPDLLRHVKPVLPYVYDGLQREEEPVLPCLLSLLVNVTSHNDVIVSEYNLRPVPVILSSHTTQNRYDIVLSCLRILINMTCAGIHFDETLVYMSMIHLLHGCKDNGVILRVLTLLRNTIPLQSDSSFNDELLRGVATVITSNGDAECVELANCVFRLISEL